MSHCKFCLLLLWHLPICSLGVPNLPFLIRTLATGFRAQSHPVGPHLNLVTTAKTLIHWYQWLDLNISCWGHNSRQWVGCWWILARDSDSRKVCRRKMWWWKDLYNPCVGGWWTGWQWARSYLRVSTWPEGWQWALGNTCHSHSPEFWQSLIPKVPWRKRNHLVLMSGAEIRRRNVGTAVAP